MLSTVACPALQYFFTISHKRYDFRKKKIMQFQSSIVDNGRDYILHYVGMSNMQIFLFFFFASSI
jgi:hypothetical protein